MKNPNYHATAFSTHPVQDKFGSLLVQFGMSKLEYMAAMIAAGLTAKNGGQVEPEVLAEESTQIAIAILERTHEEFLKDATTGGGTITLQ